MQSSGKEDTGEHTVHKKANNSTAISVCWSQAPVAQDPQWTGSQILTYHVYFIPNGVQLKDAIAFTYGDIQKAGPTTGAGSEATKVVESLEQNNDDVECEEREEVPEMGNYCISSESLKE